MTAENEPLAIHFNPATARGSLHQIQQAVETMVEFGSFLPRDEWTKDELIYQGDLILKASSQLAKVGQSMKDLAEKI